MWKNSEDARGRQCGTGGDQEFETEDLVFLVPAETKLARLWQKSLLNDDDVNAAAANGHYLHLLVLTFLLNLLGFFSKSIFSIMNAFPCFKISKRIQGTHGKPPSCSCLPATWFPTH